MSGTSEYRQNAHLKKNNTEKQREIRETKLIKL